MKLIGIKKNVLISVSVQIVSLMVSFILNLIVPKFIDVYQYSYWQMYVLYASYVGIFHFGLLDGIVLRYSQYNYDEIDKKTMRTQFQILLLSTSAIALFVIFISLLFLSSVNKIVFVLVAISIVTKNVMTYNSYTFQITNRIKDYASLILSQRISYGIAVLFLLFAKSNNFILYCLADILGDLIGALFSTKYNKNMYFGKMMNLKDALTEWKKNVSSGIYLMLATWSSFLLIGSAKIIIQIHWNELIFGKVSFAFSLSNLFLSFVSAASIVLFPSLKRMDTQQLPSLYKKIRDTITPVLFLSLLMYFPGTYILEMFLPNYADSLIYLGILLPIIVYSSKVNLLTNNYLKAYRKETDMLYINALSIIVALALFSFSAFIINNLDALLFCVVLVMFFNSILSEVVVGRIIHVNLFREFIEEFILSLVFLIIILKLSIVVGFVVYGCVLILYFVTRHKAKVKII